MYSNSNVYYLPTVSRIQIALQLSSYNCERTLLSFAVGPAAATTRISDLYFVLVISLFPISDFW